MEFCLAGDFSRNRGDDPPLGCSASSKRLPASVCNIRIAVGTFHTAPHYCRQSSGAARQGSNQLWAERGPGLCVSVNGWRELSIFVREGSAYARARTPHAEGIVLIDAILRPDRAPRGPNSRLRLHGTAVHLLAVPLLRRPGCEALGRRPNCTCAYTAADSAVRSPEGRDESTLNGIVTHLLHKARRALCANAVVVICACVRNRARTGGAVAVRGAAPRRRP